MHITCPACDAGFNVPDHLIGDKGRTVKCAKCAHQWYQHAQVDNVSEDEIRKLIAQGDDEPNWEEIKHDGLESSRGEARLVDDDNGGMGGREARLVDDDSGGMGSGEARLVEDDSGGINRGDAKLVDNSRKKKGGGGIEDVDDLAAIAAALEDGDEGEDNPPEGMDDDGDFDAFAELEAEEDPLDAEDDKGEDDPLAAMREELTAPQKEDADDGSADQKSGMRRLVGLLPALLVGLAGLVVIGGIALFFFARDTVVDLWPAFTGVYEALEMEPQSAQILKLGPINARMEEENGSPVLIVIGMINNPSTLEQPVANLRVTLFDADNRPIQQIVNPPPRDVAGPRAMFEYEIRIPSPDPAATRFQVFWDK